MAKISGLGHRLFVSGYDLSGDTQAVDNLSGGPSEFDVTAISSSARERIGSLRDGTLEVTTFFNAATGRAHPTYSALPTTDVLGSYVMGTALGAPAANLVAKQANYDVSRGDDGSLTAAVSMMGNAYGLEWGHSLTGDDSDGIASQSSAGSLTGYDDGVGAATDFGLQAYLQVFSFTGTSITVTIEDSDDDGSGDAYATVTGASFTAATGVGWERIATGSTENVKEWLRVTTTGTFSACTFAVFVVRNLTAVSF